MRSSISTIARQIAIRTKRIAVNSNNNNNILYHGKLFVKTDTNKHKNIQQITTFMESYNHIKQNGIIVVEDTHTSYMKKKGFKNL